MSGVTRGVESVSSPTEIGSPVAALETKAVTDQQTLAPEISGPAVTDLQDAANGDLHVRPATAHAADSRATQVNFRGSNNTTGSDHSIQSGSQRYYTDQQPLRPSRSRPTSFPESLLPCR